MITDQEAELLSRKEGDITNLFSVCYILFFTMLISTYDEGKPFYGQN